MKMLVVGRKISVSILMMIVLICGLQGVSYGQTITASTPSSLTEAMLNGSVVTLTLSGATFERSIFRVRGGVSVSGIDGVTVGTFDIDRVSDTRVTVELTFSGDIATDATLTFTVGAGAIAGYNGAALTVEVPVTAVTESVTASTLSPLTQATLNGSVVTLTLSGATFERSIFKVRDGVSVSGIDGVTVGTFDIDRVSDTRVTVELTFSGDIETDATLTFTVGAGAIASYNGAALTAEVPVAAVTESVTASTPFPLTEATLNGSVVTLTLSGATFERSIFKVRDGVSVSGIDGVTVGTFDIDRVSDTRVTVELTFSGDIETDATLTFTVGADAIAGYNGAALTAEVPVTGIQRSEEYILGPWLWMIANGSSIESDQLARVSSGDITENHVATHGVSEGDAVGALQWTRGRIPLTTPVCTTETVDLGFITVTNESCSTDNINELVNDIGLSENSNLNHYSAYGLINIVSPRAQNDVLMGVGSDDTVKVWLNGEVVHRYTGGSITINGNTTRTGRSTTGIQDKFRTNLKAGNNLLLVKVSEYEGEWGMFFEIYLGDEDFTTSLPGTIPVNVIEEGVSATPVVLTEATLDGGVVSLALTGLTYEQDVSKIRDAVAVSGINGVTVNTAKVQRISNTEITVELNFDGTDFTSDRDLTFSVAAGAITNYNGSALTAEVPVTASKGESLLAIYWTQSHWDHATQTRSNSKIQRANLDGSNAEDLVTQGLEAPAGIALDVAGGKMYWTDPSADKIQRANLDGSNAEDLVTQGLEAPTGIALDVAGGKMYWTDFVTDKIQRANLDGSNVEDLVTDAQGLKNPTGIALDVVDGKMYWTRRGTAKVQRANLDGSNVEDLVTQGLGLPSGIALDVAGGKMYWTDWGTDKIQRANLDGSNVEDLVTQGLEAPGGIALDVAGGRMYWTDWGTDKIQRANLDGSNVQDLVTQGLSNPSGIAIDIPSQPLSPIAREDVNRDGTVDVQDIIYVAQHYGQTGQIRADVNSDGVVNVDDIVLVAAVVDSAPAAPAIRSQLPKDLTAATVNQWLTEAKLTGNKTLTYQRGIFTLEQLLAALTPRETALLPNYPNPFNPETWIPYRLANDADVSLSIYNVDGVLVREMDLRHQRAGFYTDRTKAAYWDGRNAVGEGVASGVYFYHLKAGDYSAIRKMLILK